MWTAHPTYQLYFWTIVIYIAGHNKPFVFVIVSPAIKAHQMHCGLLKYMWHQSIVNLCFLVSDDLAYNVYRLFSTHLCYISLQVGWKEYGGKHGSLSQQSKVQKLLSVQVYNGNLPTCDSIYIKDSGLVGILIIDVNSNEWFIAKANQKLLSPSATWGILYIYNSRTCCHCLDLPTHSWVTMEQSFCFPPPLYFAFKDSCYWLFTRKCTQEKTCSLPF